MDKFVLTADIICDVWEKILAERGDVSLQDVADRLASMGYISPRTKRAYTRQNLHLTLQKTPRGRMILAKRRNMPHAGPH